MRGPKFARRDTQGAYGLQHAPARGTVLYAGSAQSTLVEFASDSANREKIVNQVSVEKICTVKQAQLQVFPAERRGPSLYSVKEIDAAFFHAVGKEIVEIVIPETVSYFLRVT